MNEQNQIVLYTDASTKAIAAVLMQVQAWIEKPCIFVSRSLPEQASMGNYRIGIVRLRLLRQASITCLLGKQFIVRTDHKNLVFG